MSNEIRTRRLIVTLPDASGEEADALIESIESHGEQARVTVNGFGVDHALDDAPLQPFVADATSGTDGKVYAQVKELGLWSTAPLTPADARRLAALLLRSADEAEEV